jgi:hypothetical protein
MIITSAENTGIDPKVATSQSWFDIAGNVCHKTCAVAARSTGYLDSIHKFRNLLTNLRTFLHTVGLVEIRTSASAFLGKQINHTFARIPKKYLLKRMNI